MAREAAQMAREASQTAREASQTAPEASQTVRLAVHLDEHDYDFDDWNGRQPLLEFLESKGVDAPYSCREGQCSACACVVLEGDLELAHNEVLDPEDLADGIRLVCQARALTDSVRISYNQ